MVYNSKKANNPIIYMLVPVVIFGAFLVYLFSSLLFDTKIELSLLTFLLVGFIVQLGLSYSILYQYHYIISDAFVCVRIGFVTVLKIPIDEIASIDEKKKGHKIYGLSLVYISIKMLSGKEYNISPEAKHAFITHLLRVNPNVLNNCAL